MLEHAWIKLKDGMQNKSNNLDDVIRLHDDYLDEILTKAMLTPAYETLNMQIQQVVQTVLRLCALEETLIFDANTALQRKRNSRQELDYSTFSAVSSVNLRSLSLDTSTTSPPGTIEGVSSKLLSNYIV